MRTERPAYRTVGAVLALVALNLLALWTCLKHPGDFSARMFDTFAYSTLGCASILGFKALGEHAANGTGLRGIVNTLMNDAKPGEPKPPASVTVTETVSKTP